MIDKVVVVTRKTRLEELIERFNTVGQARFYIEHSGGDWGEYQAEADAYKRSLEVVLRSLNLGLKMQVMERALVPTYLFTERDVVVTLGQDGLVANTAKYVAPQPIVAANPDPARFDGLLLPFAPTEVRAAVERVIGGRATSREVTLAEARTHDGQRLLAFNDLFVGSASHVSSRYTIGWQGRSEPQSSSGVLVSTGAGSTGWLSSVFNMAAGVEAMLQGSPPPVPAPSMRLPWEDPRLIFVVREPFVSRHSRAGVVAGVLDAGDALRLESLMPSGGVIFSDGVEADYVAFNSGSIVTVGAAEVRARLVVA